MFYIYLITNLINNKIYIGQTNDPALRWSQHKHTARKSKVDETIPQQTITRAIKKYGEDNFKFEVIATCKTQEDCNEVEIEMIQQFGSLDPSVGYNIDPGGKNGRRSPDTIRKVVEGRLAHYAKYGNPAKGRPLSEQHRKALSISSMGKPGTNKGKKFSDEWKQNISKSQLGKPKLNLRRFSEEEEKEICRLYVEDKLGTTVLSKKYDTFPSNIRKILQRNNIKLRSDNYNYCRDRVNDPSFLEEIKSLYQSGFTRREIRYKLQTSDRVLDKVIAKKNKKQGKNV